MWMGGDVAVCQMCGRVAVLYMGGWQSLVAHSYVWESSAARLPCKSLWSLPYKSLWLTPSVAVCFAAVGSVFQLGSRVVVVRLRCGGGEKGRCRATR